MRLAIIVPVDAGAPSPRETLQRLAPLRVHGHRVLVADAARSEAAPAWAALADRVVAAPRGWALACNLAVRAPEADGADALLFLAPECELPDGADRDVARALANGPAHWGCFGLRHATAGGPAGTWLARAGTLLTGLALREQALFATRSAFAALGGFDPAAADPTLDLSRRALALGRPAVLRAAVRVRPARGTVPPPSAFARERQRWSAALHGGPRDPHAG